MYSIKSVLSVRVWRTIVLVTTYLKWILAVHQLIEAMTFVLTGFVSTKNLNSVENRQQISKFTLSI